MAYESATYYTNKIIKTTKAQYDALKNGESVKGYKLNAKDTFVLDIDSLYNDIPTKTSQLTIDNAIALKAGTNVSLVNDGSGVTINADGSVKTVNNTAPDSNGNVALGLATVATSGSYNDLSHKPNIPNPTNYYWANVKISSSSSKTTTPIFDSVEIKEKCTVSYSATADALEFIFK